MIQKIQKKAGIDKLGFGHAGVFGLRPTKLLAAREENLWYPG